MTQANNSNRSRQRGTSPLPASTKLRVVILGGLGEVGKNIMAIEYGEDIIVVDCGMGFPTSEMPGVDVVLPDVTYLEERKANIRGIFLTHGHEDHVGALPYLLPRINAPIYGSRFTMSLVSDKLKEHKLLGSATMNVIETGKRYQAGAFSVEFYHIVHSIPDSCGLAIHTPVGTLIHTGDFKLDMTPIDGVQADFAAITRFGSEGVLALMSECVRAEYPGFTPTEQEVRATLDGLFSRAAGRIIIATFGSLISRVQIALDLGHKYGRKVAVLGRSMENNTDRAIELGILKVPEDTLIRVGQARDLGLDKVVVVVTGAQGEPTAVLSRIAYKDSRHINILPGDTVILSSSPIPGNEVPIVQIINALIAQGADVHYNQIERVHVSGHAARDELRLFLSMVQPRYVIPIHGENRMLVQYARMAAETGWAKESIFITHNGSVIEFDAQGKASIADDVQAGPVFMDGNVAGNINPNVLKERQTLSRDGVLSLAIRINSESGDLSGPPELSSLGFVPLQENAALLNGINETIARVVAQERYTATNGDWPLLSRRVKESLGQYIYTQTRQRPIIVPLIMEV